MPLSLIEIGIGQQFHQGSIGVWKEIHPRLGGLGISSTVVSFLVGLYYNVVITWCIYYLFRSFTVSDFSALFEYMRLRGSQ
jgi:solute carrier family 6 amino acid/orphan transporter-like 15/16/17/18/20